MFTKTLIFIWELLKIAILAFIIVVPIRYFLFQPFIVRGASMEPNFHSGDYLIIDEITYRFRDPQRGEVVVFSFPKNPSQRYIKRIIGLPGETLEIKEGKIEIFSLQGQRILDESSYLPPSYQSQISGEIKVTLNENEYFVLGDNRSFSSDSRSWGPLPRKYIIGRVFLRAWPLTAFAKIEAPEYK